MNEADKKIEEVIMALDKDPRTIISGKVIYNDGDTVKVEGETGEIHVHLRREHLVEYFPVGQEVQLSRRGTIYLPHSTGHTNLCTDFIERK